MVPQSRPPSARISSISWSITTVISSGFAGSNTPRSSPSSSCFRSVSTQSSPCVKSTRIVVSPISRSSVPVIPTFQLSTTSLASPAMKMVSFCGSTSQLPRRACSSSAMENASCNPSAPSFRQISCGIPIAPRYQPFALSSRTHGTSNTLSPTFTKFCAA